MVGSTLSLKVSRRAPSPRAVMKGGVINTLQNARLVNVYFEKFDCLKYTFRRFVVS